MYKIRKSPLRWQFRWQTELSVAQENEIITKADLSILSMRVLITNAFLIIMKFLFCRVKKRLTQFESVSIQSQGDSERLFKCPVDGLKLISITLKLLLHFLNFLQLLRGY